MRDTRMCLVWLRAHQGDEMAGCGIDLGSRTLQALLAFEQTNLKGIEVLHYVNFHFSED
jgi:hypothetical protein